MAQLGLAAPELSKSLCDRHAFYSSLEQLVECRASCRELFDIFPALKNFHACLEPLALNLLCYLVTLLCFGLRDTLYVEHLLLGAANYK